MLQTTCHPCISRCGRCLALGAGHDCCFTCLGSKHAEVVSSNCGCSSRSCGQAPLPWKRGKPCFLFRACRYSSGLIRWGLCGLWRCCLHLTPRRYCRFFRLKALRDMHGGGHDPDPDLAPRAMKVRARSLGRAMSTHVVQERHLWLCLVDIGTPTKFGSCIPDWPLRRRNR